MDITQEKTPHYIIELKKDLTEHFDKKIDESMDELAISMAKQFKDIEDDIAGMKDDITGIKDEMQGMVRKEDIKDMATKEDIKPIFQLIASYNVLAFNNQEILLKDHKPRIVDLEKIVFA